MNKADENMYLCLFMHNKAPNEEKGKGTIKMETKDEYRSTLFVFFRFVH